MRASASGRTRAVGVVIPANNEERYLHASFMALEESLRQPSVRGLRRHVVVVLDSCEDRSRSIAEHWRKRAVTTAACEVTIVDCDELNVGRARALGCDVLLGHFHTYELDGVWLATSDADSRVPAHWLSVQVNAHDHGADAWAGRIAITEWPRHRVPIAARWQRAYDAESRPVHGASFGVNAQVYLDVGGFPPLRTSEDRGLHGALVARGANIHYDSLAPVVTSARRTARAPEGFAAALTLYEVPGTCA